MLKAVGLSVIAIFTLALVTTFSVWMGILLGEQLYHPVTEIYHDYANTTCLVNYFNLTSETCCYQSCSQCSECDTMIYPSCYNTTFQDSIYSNLSSSRCCGSSKCCKTCCETCRSCRLVGKAYVCNSYTCNCKCCDSVDYNLCTYRCNACWSINVQFNYSTESETFKLKETFNCDSMECVDSISNNYQLNTSRTCYYNPLKPQFGAIYKSQYVTTTEKESYKYAIMYTFIALFILSFIGLVITFIVISIIICLKRVKFSNLQQVFNPAHNELASNDSNH